MQTQGIRKSDDLGLAHRSFDLALGSIAILPIVGSAIDVWIDRSNFLLITPVVAIWSGVLLIFFAGVRRGLTFSEAGGGRPFELLSMLWLFVLGAATIWLQNVVTAMVGFASVGVLDWLSARKFEAPPYFRVFRPLQMGVAVIGLLSVFICQR